MLDGLTHWLRMRMNNSDGLQHWHQGMALEDLGNLQEALREYQLANADPDMAGFDPLHGAMARILAQQGDINGAIHEYNLAIRLRPDEPDYYYRRGSLLMGQGRLDEAVLSFKAILRLPWDYPRANFRLGLAMYLQGRIGDAIIEFRASLRPLAIIGSPDVSYHAECRYYLALALMEYGDPHEAATQFTESSKLNNERGDSHLAFAHALFELVQHREGPSADRLLSRAEGACKEALSLDSTLLEAHYCLAKVLALRGSSQEAAEEASLLPRGWTDAVSELLRMGDTLADQRDWEGALVQYRLALRHEMDNPRGHYGLSCVFENVGEKHSAMTQYRLAAHYDPGFDAAHARLVLH